MGQHPAAPSNLAARHAASLPSRALPRSVQKALVLASRRRFGAPLHGLPQPSEAPGPRPRDSTCIFIRLQRAKKLLSPRLALAKGTRQGAGATAACTGFLIRSDFKYRAGMPAQAEKSLRSQEGKTLVSLPGSVKKSHSAWRGRACQTVSKRTRSVPDSGSQPTVPPASRCWPLEPPRLYLIGDNYLSPAS